MPAGCTVLSTLKLPKSVAEKVKLPATLSRSSKATSDGELTRVGTLGVENFGSPLVRLTSESLRWIRS